jgi:hypothetical protein
MASRFVNNYRGKTKSPSVFKEFPLEMKPWYVVPSESAIQELSNELSCQ